jgi:hypothetical protein
VVINIENPISPMVTTADVYALRAKLNQLKRQLYYEQISQEQKDVANRYLNRVIDYVEQSLKV